LLPEFLDDYVAEDNPVRVVDVFIDELDLEALGFSGVAPEVTARACRRELHLSRNTLASKIMFSHDLGRLW
jgi:hypothetical protein